LTAAVLAHLFDGDTRVVRRLAALEDPLGQAYDVLRTAPEDEQVEALNAHPQIGAGALSATSAQEQGDAADPTVRADLAALNRAYEAKFGFRHVIFVQGRSQAALRDILRTRLTHTREDELTTGLAEVVAIAKDRYGRL